MVVVLLAPIVMIALLPGEFVGSCSHSLARPELTQGRPTSHLWSYSRCFLPWSSFMYWKKAIPSLLIIDFGATVAIPEYNSILVVDVVFLHALYVGRNGVFRVIPWINIEAGSWCWTPSGEALRGWTKWLPLCWTSSIKVSVWLQALPRLSAGMVVIECHWAGQKGVPLAAIIAWGWGGEWKKQTPKPGGSESE